MFKANRAKLDESQSGPLHPYVGRAHLVEVNLDSPSKKDGAPDYDVIQFLFRLEEGEEKGTTYRHIEWDPQGDASKAENLANRVAHIATNFLPMVDKEKAKDWAEANITGETWAEYRERVNEIFNEKITPAKYMAKNDIRIKILGSVPTVGKNANKPRLSMPGYVGFISDGRSKAQVAFSADEMQDNAKYEAALRRSPDDMEEGGETPYSFGGDAPAPAATKAATPDTSGAATSGPAENEKDPWGM